MRVLVFAGPVQGISTPFLMIVTFITNDKTMIGGWTNSTKMNTLRWIPIFVMSAALRGCGSRCDP